MNPKYYLTPLFFLIVLILALHPTPQAIAQEPDADLLRDPLVLGAWLYEGHCIRCHGPYDEERVGQDFWEDELISAIERGGCAVDWSREHGGPLKSREIKALVRFILAWEEAGAPPNIAPLPNQPTPTPLPTKDPSPETSGWQPTPTATPEPLPETIQLIVDSNRLAHGAWLYTQYCYRCHQAYQATRMGRGMAVDLLEEVIENGKTATNMTAFSRSKGGPLKSSEIDAVVYYITTWETMGVPPALPAEVMVAPTPDPADFEPVALAEAPLVSGDPARGAILYTTYCVMCHGERGEGYLGPTLAREWLTRRPDLTIRGVIEMGVPGTAMPAWSQDQGGPLHDEDIADLVAHLLTWADRTPEATVVRVAAGPPKSPWTGWPGLLLLLLGPLALGLTAFLIGPPRR